MARNLSAEKRTPLDTRWCINCRESFIPWRSDQVFCSNGDRTCRDALQLRERRAVIPYHVALNVQGYKCAGCGVAAGVVVATEVAEGKRHALTPPVSASLLTLLPMVLDASDPDSLVVAVCGPCKRKHQLDRAANEPD